MIFYYTEAQKETAEKYKNRLSEEKVRDAPIVIEITPINNYSEAEAYHHDYLKNNPQNPYYQSVVRPKVDKFRKVFQEKLKEKIPTNGEDFLITSFRFFFVCDALLIC